MVAIQLPYWASTIRPHQAAAVQEILAAFQHHPIVILDAPTGSGKTLIGELVRQYLSVRGLYLCSSIQLQSQFAKDFPDAAVLKGRANYPTFDDAAKFPDLTAADCVKARGGACGGCRDEEPDDDQMHCRWCHPVASCPYEIAKKAAIRAPLTNTNTSYFLHEANHVGMLPLNRGLIVVDEADTLEDALVGFVEVYVSQRRAEEWGIALPAKKTVESAWVEWAEHTQAQLKKVKIAGGGVKAIRGRQALSKLRGNVARLNDPKTGITAGGWVYTGRDGVISFKPVEVAHLAEEFLWRHGKKWLLMSATTISFQVMAEGLGL